MHPYIAVPVTAALVWRAYSRDSLTPAGIVVAALTAVVHAIHPWSVFFALLVVFFLAGTAVTKVYRLITRNPGSQLSNPVAGKAPCQGPTHAFVGWILRRRRSTDACSGSRQLARGFVAYPITLSPAARKRQERPYEPRLLALCFGFSSRRHSEVRCHSWCWLLMPSIYRWLILLTTVIMPQ